MLLGLLVLAIVVSIVAVIGYWSTSPGEFLAGLVAALALALALSIGATGTHRKCGSIWWCSSEEVKE